MNGRNVFYNSRKLVIILILIILAEPLATALNETISVPTTTRGFFKTKTLETATSATRICDCMLTVKNVAAGLGTVLLIETIFCCFVVYLWLKGRRRAVTTQLCQNSSNDRSNNHVDKPKNITPSERKTEGKIKSRPTSSHQTPTSNIGTVVLRKIRDFLPKIKSSPQSPQEPNGIALDVEPGNDFYSVAYDEHVNAAALIGAATNQQAIEEKHQPINDISNAVLGELASLSPQEAAFYHVLEESGSLSPQGPKKQGSLYYCIEDCVDKTIKEDVFYHVLEESASQPQGPQEDNSLYYSCEECTDKPTLYNPQGQSQASPNTVKFKSKKPLKSKLITKSTASNQISGIPIGRNSRLNHSLIREMKTRAAQKKTGN